VTGFWPDGWVSERLLFDLKPLKSIGRLVIAGSVPAALPEGQDFQLRVGEDSWSHHAKPGRFKWTVPLALEAGAVASVEISAARSWTPSSDGQGDVRALAWQVTRVEGLMP
jgi:hypothetical protein